MSRHVHQQLKLTPAAEVLEVLLCPHNEFAFVYVYEDLGHGLGQCLQR